MIDDHSKHALCFVARVPSERNFAQLFWLNFLGTEDQDFTSPDRHVRVESRSRRSLISIIQDEQGDIRVMMTRCVVAALALLASFLTACDGPLGLAGEIPAHAAMAQSDTYMLSPGDKVKVTVFNEPDLTGEFQIGASGDVAFPLIGNVKAAGLSATEFQNQLLRRLRNGYVRNARVSVEVAAYRPFNVFGEVRNAGQYPFRPGLTVQDAIAMAGGFTYRANSRTAYVRRANANTETAVQLDGPRVSILPGDDVRIPERYF